jgi:large subunit ribosomal protein L25
MSDRPRLAASTRTVTGKGVARLRRAGQLPAVVFGHGAASESLTLDSLEFDRIRRHVGASTLVDLAIDGAAPRPVLLQGVQHDLLSGRPIHVDLFAVQMTEEIVAEVRLVPDGSAPAQAAGGSLVHPVSMVRARALPGDLPETIHYSLEGLTGFESTITVADLIVPAGVTLQADPNDVIARVLVPRDVVVAAEGEVAPAAAD